MRRHGWALCLGAILAGTAAAQPPAAEERFPPAPDLPGEVIGQLPAAPTGDVKGAKPAPPAPLPDAALAPYTSTATTTVAPVGPATTPCPAPRHGCSIGLGDVKEWLLFRSKARQSGHFVTPYRPPLQAWFPCEPGRAPCGVGPVIGGPMGPLPAVMPLADGPPTAPVSPEPPLGGGVAVGKCLDAEVLTTFQPVAPGIGFTPGGSPMANPTSQIKPTSFKPK